MWNLEEPQHDSLSLALHSLPGTLRPPQPICLGGLTLSGTRLRLVLDHDQFSQDPRHHIGIPKSCFASLLAMAWRVAYKPHALLIVWDSHIVLPVAL